MTRFQLWVKVPDGREWAILESITSEDDNFDYDKRLRTRHRAIFHCDGTMDSDYKVVKIKL